MKDRFLRMIHPYQLLLSNHQQTLQTVQAISEENKQVAINAAAEADARARE